MLTLRPSSVLRVRRGSTVNVCCKAKGSPPPKIEWSRAQSSPNAIVLFQENGCLAINTAKVKPIESYICRATNSYGVTQTTTTFITSPGRVFYIRYNLIWVTFHDLVVYHLISSFLTVYGFPLTHYAPLEGFLLAEYILQLKNKVFTKGKQAGQSHANIRIHQT